MKIQCSCGAKSELNVIPEMATRPIRWVCSACGLDASEFVNDLVRQELASLVPPPAAAPAPQATPAPRPILPTAAPRIPSAIPTAAPAAAPVGVLLDSPAPATQPPAARPAIRVQGVQAAAPESAPGPPSEDLANQNLPVCLKHGGEYALEKCFICRKPICPKCMELFGYVCSPLCKAKADSHGIKIPVYALQRDVIEAQQWRKIVRIMLSAAAVLVAFIGVWTWYAWFGSTPKPAFSLRFPEPSFSGSSFICGKDNQEIVFLHGTTLARYEMKQKKELWSRELLDHKLLALEAAKQIKEMQADRDREALREPEYVAHLPALPTVEKWTRQLARWRASELELFVRGSNVWVSTQTNLTRYAWEDGTPANEIRFKTFYSTMTVRGDDLVLVDRPRNFAPPVVTHINLATCDTHTEDYGLPTSSGTNIVTMVPSPGGMLVRGSGDSGAAGLPVGMPGKDAGKPMDPGKVAEEARHLPLPARIALPAVLSGAMTQERTLAELDGEAPKHSGRIKRDPGETVSFVPTKEGYIQVGVKTVKQNLVERNAMKAAPAKSVVDGNLTVANTADAANEILNEMQRNRGGGGVLEDFSTYRVSLRNPGEEGGWAGEVIGPPALFPMDNAYVLSAGTNLMVFDKSYKLMWQRPIQFGIGRYDMSTLDADSAPNGQGPCAEYKGWLYVFDEGTLSVFELASGNLQWRLPSVGIAGMFFDGNGNMYVNTTTANLDSIKYSRQIDITRRTSDIVLKLDCRTGKTLWRAEPGGMVNYVSGKFIYVVSFYQPYDDDEEDADAIASLGGNTNPYLKIRRISPRSGSEMWTHFQQRAPLDIQFDKNVIRLVFKKEVQVLKFLTF